MSSASTRTAPGSSRRPSGTVANKATEDEPVARNFRLQLDLELVDGEWLTSNLEFVG